MRLTTIELHAVLHALTSVTAGDWDGWSEVEAAACERAEEKLRAVLHARKDYAAAEARIEASPEIFGR